MRTEGLLAPATPAAVRDRYEAVEPAARVAATEVARALGIDDASDADVRKRVDENVVLTAHEAIFASLLVIHVGTREEFEAWLADRDREVTEQGSEHVPGVAWHDAPAADRVLAATYADEPEAAVHALRRQAFAKVYREVV